MSANILTYPTCLVRAIGQEKLNELPTIEVDDVWDLEHTEVAQSGVKGKDLKDRCFISFISNEEKFDVFFKIFQQNSSVVVNYLITDRDDVYLPGLFLMNDDKYAILGDVFNKKCSSLKFI